MVMMGLELTDKVPFHTVYLHGLVRDAQGRKMSKTTGAYMYFIILSRLSNIVSGNVIDPLDTIDSFGSDALRYSLVTGSTPGQDIPLSVERIEANRNFANKLWNAGVK
jgi:valyl-tRNA synthetase